MRTLAIILLALALAGCASAPRPRVAASIATEVDGVECRAELEL